MPSMGFLNMLLKLYGELDPQYVAVAFDKSKHTFRNDLFDGYKATRKPAPDDLRPQFALIREVLACLGICVLEQEGYEGDDIIGTLARRTAADGYAVAVVTGDRDALQLGHRRRDGLSDQGKGSTNMAGSLRRPSWKVNTAIRGPGHRTWKALMAIRPTNIPASPASAKRRRSSSSASSAASTASTNTWTK